MGEPEWRVPSRLRSEIGEVKRYRSWGLPGYHCHKQAERPHRPADRWRMLRRKTPRQITKSFSVTRKSRTTACRRSMCSTRKMPHNLSSANRSPGAAGDADAAAAGAVVAGAAGEVAGAVAAAEAVAGPGASVAGVRSNNAKSM